MLGDGVYGGWRGTALVLGAPALQVSRITVRGNERLSTGEVLRDCRRAARPQHPDRRSRRVARAAAGVAVGRGRGAAAHAAVAHRDRDPRAAADRASAALAGTLYLVDAHGVVIDEYGPNYARFRSADHRRPGGSRRPTATSAVGRGAGAAGGAADRGACRRGPISPQRVSQIDVTDAHDAVVILEGDTAMLRLGEEEFVERIQEYLDLAPALRERVAGDRLRRLAVRRAAVRAPGRRDGRRKWREVQAVRARRARSEPWRRRLDQRANSASLDAGAIAPRTDWSGRRSSVGTTRTLRGRARHRHLEGLHGRRRAGRRGRRRRHRARRLPSRRG